jgi:hypothetical protein
MDDCRKLDLTKLQLTLEMNIVPTNGSFTQVRFTSTSGNSLPTGATTSGFGWFGTSVAYAASSSEYKLMFWAVSTNITGIYVLYWNTDGTLLSVSFRHPQKHPARCGLARMMREDTA